MVSIYLKTEDFFMNKYKEIAQTTRLLSMYRMLLCGESLCKKELAARYAVSEKSIQRDIECLRDFIAETEAGKIRLIYTRRENLYILDSSGSQNADECDTACAIAAILRDVPELSPESRAAMQGWILDQLSPAERYRVWKRILEQ